METNKSPLVDRLLAFISSGEHQKKDSSPEGVCPNCWGRQEYGGQFYEAIHKHGLDVNSEDRHRGWIQDYADKYLTGIDLTEPQSQLACPSCKLSYKPG